MDITQQRIIEAIEKSGLAYRELEEKTGIPKSTLHRYLHGDGSRIPVDKLGAIAKACHVSPLWLLGMNEDPTPVKLVPLLGEIACGAPAYTGEYEGEHILIPTDSDADYAITCKGDSMIDVGIYAGDRALIRQQADVDDGDIAAILVDGETTLKRVYRPTPNILILHAENENVADLLYKGEALNEIRILGKLVGVLKRF